MIAIGCGGLSTGSTATCAEHRRRPAQAGCRGAWSTSNGEGPIAGIYFRLADSERVWVGHYAQAHREMTAAEAVAAFLQSSSREGWEVLVPRRINAKEIHRVRALPQVVGWRYFPAAKGKPIVCTCDYCIKGQYGAQRLRRRLSGGSGGAGC